MKCFCAWKREKNCLLVFPFLRYQRRCIFTFLCKYDWLNYRFKSENTTFLKPFFEIIFFYFMLADAVENHTCFVLLNAHKTTILIFIIFLLYFSMYAVAILDEIKWFPIKKKICLWLSLHSISLDFDNIL